MPIYSIQQKRNLILFIIIALGSLVAYYLINFISAFIGALILYTLFHKFYLHLNNTRKWKAHLAALFTILISLLCIVLPLWLLVGLIVNKINYYSSHAAEVNQTVDFFISYVKKYIPDSGFVQENLKKIINQTLSAAPLLLNSIARGLLMLALAYFIFYFMLTGNKEMAETLKRFLPFNSSNNKHFQSELYNVVFSNLVGQGLIAVVQGALVGIGFWIFGVPDALFWGVISVYLSFLPVIGAPVVYIPAALLKLAAGDTGQGIGLLLWGLLLVSSADNFLRIFFAKRLGNMHPLVTLLGVLIGVPAFGFLGIVAGPLLLQFFIILMRIYESRGDEKHTVSAQGH